MHPSDQPQSPHPAASVSRPAHARASRSAGKRGKNRLLVLGSAAVLAVYAAGYFRTRAAAQQFDLADSAGRRGATPPAAALAAPPPAATAEVELVAPQKSELVSASSVPVPLVSAPTPTSTPVPAAVASPVAAAFPSVSPMAASPVPAAAPVAASVVGSPAALPEVVAAVTPVAEVPVKIAEAPRPKWKDGKFSGWGSCRHGDIEATIEIKGGRIISAIVSDCRTRYACDVIDKIIPQVVARQSADVDTVSGATQSADAFYYAVTAALASAKPEAVKAL